MCISLNSEHWGPSFSQHCCNVWVKTQMVLLCSLGQQQSQLHWERESCCGTMYGLTLG